MTGPISTCPSWTPCTTRPPRCVHDRRSCSQPSVVSACSSVSRHDLELLMRMFLGSRRIALQRRPNIAYTLLRRGSRSLPRHDRNGRTEYRVGPGVHDLDRMGQVSICALDEWNVRLLILSLVCSAPKSQEDRPQRAYLYHGFVSAGSTQSVRLLADLAAPCSAFALPSRSVSSVLPLLSISIWPPAAARPTPGLT